MLDFYCTLQSSTHNLETLNLGHNNITNEGIHLLKEGLLVSKSLLRLGLQGTKISCEGRSEKQTRDHFSIHKLQLENMIYGFYYAVVFAFGLICIDVTPINKVIITFLVQVLLPSQKPWLTVRASCD